MTNTAKTSMMKVDKAFEPLIAELQAEGFEQWIHLSEFWWVDYGLETLARRTSNVWLDDAAPEEKKYASIVWKHFPEVEAKAKEHHNKRSK